MIKIFVPNIAPTTEETIRLQLQVWFKKTFPGVPGTIESTRAKVKTDLNEGKQ